MEEISASGIHEPNDYSDISVLIVDDEDTYRRFIAAIVEKHFKIKPVICKNPKEAFDYMKESKIPDLIILDMQMPIMDGLTTLKHLRSANKTKGIEVIINTALSTDSLLIELFKLGIADYIVKPSDTIVMSKKILNVLKKIRKAKIINE